MVFARGYFIRFFRSPRYAINANGSSETDLIRQNTMKTTMKTTHTRSRVKCVSILALGLFAASSAHAASYFFQYSDTYDNVATVDLTTGVSGYTDGSELVISGTLTLTSSMNSDAYLGTYTLVAGGPADTRYFMILGKGSVFFDNLFYPNQNAGAGVKDDGTNDPSYLNYSGLLFNKSDSPYSISLFGSGSANDYGLWVNDYNTQAGLFRVDSTGTLVASAVPEPSSAFLSALGASMLLRRRRRQAA
jgi:hypothetical protein